MNYILKIAFQSFVKSFYKENAGAFVFVFTMLFFIVNTVDGAGLYRYHYSLATAMLKSNTLLIIVFFAWFLYVRKFTAFVSAITLNPAYQFLYVYNLLGKTRRILLFLFVEILLLIPVLSYSVFIGFVAFSEKLYIPFLFVTVYLLLLFIIPAIWHIYLLNGLFKPEEFRFRGLFKKTMGKTSFVLILSQLIIHRQRVTWMGIKIYTCCVIYLIARNNTIDDYETGTAFLFFNFGVLANAVLIYRLREFEETYLNFYRGLPVSLPKRYLEYSLVYFILLIPETVTLWWLTPIHLHYNDAISFIICSHCLVILMHGLLLFQNSTMKEYLKILLLLLFVQYVFLMTVGFIFLFLFSLISSVLVFLTGYYRFERKPNNGIVV